MAISTATKDASPARGLTIVEHDLAGEWTVAWSFPGGEAEQECLLLARSAEISEPTFSRSGDDWVYSAVAVRADPKTACSNKVVAHVTAAEYHPERWLALARLVAARAASGSPLVTDATTAAELAAMRSAVSTKAAQASATAVTFAERCHAAGTVEVAELLMPGWNVAGTTCEALEGAGGALWDVWVDLPGRRVVVAPGGSAAKALVAETPAHDKVLSAAGAAAAEARSAGTDVNVAIGRAVATVSKELVEKLKSIQPVTAESLATAGITGPFAMFMHAVAAAEPGAGSREIVVAEDFETVYGEVLPEVRVTVEEWGDTTLGPDRTIAIFPSFSHGHHVAANASDPSPGWWDGMVGPGRWLDTNRFRIVCSSVLGSPMGSTSPRSVDPRTGRPYRMRFPTITTADQARAHALALDALGLDRVHAAVGASLGGMQVLQFATLFPERVGRVAALVSTGQTSPGSVALRRIQRQAIMADPDWRGGDYEDAAGPASRGPLTGLRLAREVGMLVYRSRQEFDSRFDWRATGEPGPADTTFEVESYLAYQGAKFARGGAMDANSYLKLSKCMDLHNIANPRLRPGNTFEDAAADIRADALLIGVEQDMLTPAQELRALAQAMTAGGGRAEFRSISSEFGHDAFLKEFDTLGPMLRDHVEKGIRQQLDLEEVHTTGLSHP